MRVLELSAAVDAFCGWDTPSENKWCALHVPIPSTHVPVPSTHVPVPSIHTRARTIHPYTCPYPPYMCRWIGVRAAIGSISDVGSVCVQPSVRSRPLNRCACSHRFDLGR
eukprot:9482464-Pyramimonas_sp.AAC.1